MPGPNRVEMMLDTAETFQSLYFEGLSSNVTYQYRIQLVLVFDRFGVRSLDEVSRQTGHSEATLGVLYSLN